MQPSPLRVFAFLLTALLVIAVAVQAEEPEGGVVFHHRVHLDEGLECQDCHDVSRNRPVLDREICTDCHDETPTGFRLPLRALRLPFQFLHVKHSRRFDCRTCHQGTVAEQQAAGRVMVEYGACMACHRARGAPVVGTRCVQCHGEDRARVRPGDHRAGWLEQHGKESRWRSVKAHGKTCGQCHRTDTCRSCHRTRRPASHTALWRNRLHGLEAGWDRDGCKTCHETGTCVQCHRTTRPQNHAGSWLSVHPLVAGSVGNETCRVCHTPGFCTGCHEG